MSAGGASPRVSVLSDDPCGSRGPRRGPLHGGVSPGSGSPARRGPPHPRVGVSPRSGSPACRPSVGGGPRVLTASPSGLQVSFVSGPPPPSRPATSEVDNATTTPGRRGKRLLAPSASRYMVARQWALMSVSLTTRQTSAALRPARLAHPLAGVHASAFYADHTVRRRGTEACSRSWTEDGTMWLDRNRGNKA